MKANWLWSQTPRTLQHKKPSKCWLLLELRPREERAFKSVVPTLLMCSCCCWNCCLCFSKNCWCCCWITNCWRAWAFWGRGADCVRPSGRCCRSLCIEGETRSPPTRDCAWRGSPERYQSEDNMEEKTAEKKKRKKKGREKTAVE